MGFATSLTGVFDDGLSEVVNWPRRASVDVMRSLNMRVVVLEEDAIVALILKIQGLVSKSR